MTSDVPIEEQWSETHEAKQRNLKRAIEQLDRRLARTLIVDEEIDPTGVVIGEDHLLRFLKVAVQSRDAALVRKLLERKPNLASFEASQILWIVVEDGDTEIATMLVRAGTDLNSRRLDGGTTTTRKSMSFLHVLASSSASARKHRLAMLMLQHGADATACDATGSSVLVYAVRTSAPIALCEELLRRGARVDECVVQHDARHPNASLLLPILVERGCVADDDNARSKRITMALIYLVNESDDSTAAEALLQLGLPIGELEKRGHFLLYTAVVFNRIQIVELLLAYGADANKKHRIGFFYWPLHAAATLETSKITEMLIRSGADIHNRSARRADADGQYPIHAACESESFDNIQLLLRLNADVNVLDTHGNTPFTLMYPKYLSSLQLRDVHRLVIKRLALLVFQEIDLQQSDVIIINNHLEMQKFVKECVDELEKMNVTIIADNVSFYSIFASNSKKLSLIARNDNIVEHYKISQREALFPLYFPDMDFYFENAEMRKNELVAMENALHEMLGGIFPSLVTKKIGYYLYWNDV